MRRKWWIAVLVVLADRAVKLIAPAWREPVTLIPGVLGLRYAENTGMAFSLFSGVPWLLGALSAVLITVGIVALRRHPLRGLALVAAMLMLGGAAGNMIDRLWTGHVVDMVEVLLFRFAIFNLADAALTIGCVLMAWSLWRRPQEWEGAHA